MSAFRPVQEFKNGRPSRVTGRDMFDATIRFGFLDEENGSLRTELATLGRDIELWRVRSSGHEIQLSEPEKITYLLPLRGRLDVAVAQQEYAAGNGSALLFSSNKRRTRVLASNGRMYEALVVMVPAAAIRQILDRQDLVWRHHALELPAGQPRGAGLRSYLQFLGDELSRPQTPLNQQPVMAGVAAILQEFILELVSDGQGGSEQKAQSAGIGYVLRAEDIMWERYDEAITVADIAETLGVGLRSLQIAFHEHRGHPPREALTRIRLKQARKRLEQAGDRENIAHIAMDCGFTHMGRFSQAYRSIFGELPSETTRARSAVN